MLQLYHVNTINIINMYLCDNGSSDNNCIIYIVVVNQ